MTTKQQILVEVLRLKMHLVRQLGQHNLTVYTQDILAKVDAIVEAIAEIDDK